MKKSLGVSVIAVSLMSGVLRATVPCADQELIIYLINSAGVPDRNVEQATRRASRILITAGTTIAWRIHPENVQDPLTSPPKKPLNYDIRLKIVRGVPRSLPNRTLAYSLPSVHIGTNITIFYDRVERVSHDVEIDSGSVLGLVMAHEIGHMVLRSAKHSPAGIMKSPWTKSDIQQAAVHLETFTSLERSVIRRCAFPELLSGVRPAKTDNRRHEAVFAPE